MTQRMPKSSTPRARAPGSSRSRNWPGYQNLPSYAGLLRTNHAFSCCRPDIAFLFEEQRLPRPVCNQRLQKLLKM
jgi:hypothetical protein